MIKYKHVEGREDSKVVLFTLSTCGWCKKMKLLLNELCIAYDYVDMDQLDAEDVDNAKIILKNGIQHYLFQQWLSIMKHV